MDKKTNKEWLVLFIETIGIILFLYGYNTSGQEGLRAFWNFFGIIGLGMFLIPNYFIKKPPKKRIKKQKPLLPEGLKGDLKKAVIDFSIMIRDKKFWKILKSNLRGGGM